MSKNKNKNTANANFVPHDKLSPRKQREEAKKARTQWAINPVTRMPENSRAYNRNTEKRNWKRYADC